MLENYVMMMNKENDNIYKIKLMWCKFYFGSAFELLHLDKTCNFSLLLWLWVYGV
jgi:hypothetical protein